MKLSLNCLILGQTNSFVINVGEKYVDDTGIDVNFSEFTVSHFKEQLFRKGSVNAVVQNSDSMDLLKVELDIKSLKDKNEDEIRNSGMIMEPTDYLYDYFKQTPTKKFLHIVIQPLSLITGSHKRVKMMIRTFCPSNHVDPEENFYIKPKELVENLGKHIIKGEFCLFHGYRQSGKTTTVWELKNWIENNSKYKVYYLNFNRGIITNEGLSEFWRSVCVKMESAIPDYVDEVSFFTFFTASVFERLFNINKTKLRDVILIIDEASRLIVGNNETSWSILNEFIASLRVLSDQSGHISTVHSVVLVGTEVIKDFLLAQAQRSKNYTWIISPFSAKTVNSVQFTSLEVRELLAQYAKENRYEIDVGRIAADVYSLTLGHKGLVGACYYYLENIIMSRAIKATLDDWEKHVPILLPEYIRNLATYKSTVKCFENLNENQRDKKVTMKEYDVKFLLAEGLVVIDSQNGDGTGLIRCAAPILRTIMLSSIRGPNIMPSSLPINANYIDPKWLLESTVKNLSTQNIFHEKPFNSNNEPSEYAFQAEFLCIFKQLISKAYPTLGYRVHPEVKESDEGVRRRQHLNILVRNKDLPVYGFELSVAASETVFDDHLEHSDYYSKIHNCDKMYTIDISPSKKLAKYFGKQEYEKVIPVHVIYNLEDGKAN